MTIYHVSISLDRLIHRGEAALLAGHVKLPRATRWATEAEIIVRAAILKGVRAVRPLRGRGATAGHGSFDEALQPAMEARQRSGALSD